MKTDTFNPCLTADEVIEEIDYIARIVPDTLEEARAMIEDIFDLTSSYLEADEAGKGG